MDSTEQVICSHYENNTLTFVNVMYPYSYKSRILHGELTEWLKVLAC